MVFEGDVAEGVDVVGVVSVLQGAAFHLLLPGVDETLRRHIVEVGAFAIFINWQ